MLIRACRAGDLGRLEASTVLLAWDGDVPVGGVEIRWDGCAAPEVATRFPGCPELNALDVWDRARRGAGVGTALVRHAEEMVRRRGRPQVGLGVADDNPRAARLYARLGYRDAGCPYLDRWEVILADGTTVEVADRCRFLLSDL